MSMDIQEAEDRICQMVNIVQDYVTREEFEEYDAAGVEALMAMNKRIKMPVGVSNDGYRCICRKLVSKGDKFCSRCGQALKW